MDEEADGILDKADAFLARHRSAPMARPPAPPPDYPVLTDVWSAPALQLAPATPPAPEVAMLSDLDLAELERELRLQLLELMGPELGRLVEARLHMRLDIVISSAMARTRVELQSEIKRSVQDTLAQVLAEETARLQRSGL